MPETARNARAMLLFIEYQKALGILHAAKEELFRMGEMDEKGTCIKRLTPKQMRALTDAYNDGIKHIKGLSHEMLEAAKQEHSRAVRERLAYVQYMNKHKSLLKVRGGKVEETDEYQALLLKEHNALAQLEVIRKTQFENQFTEHNAAKGITQ